MSKSTQTHTKIELSRLKYNPKNPRKINDEKLKKLVKSIKEFPEMMAKRPIVCVTDKEDGLLIPLGGNMRLRALKELKLSEIPNSWVVLADDWTEEQRNEFIIKDNVAFGEWDAELLNMEFEPELLADWGLDAKSFDLPEVLPLEAVEDDFEIKNTVDTDIVIGDLFEIGKHRLICGDSTKIETFEKLFVDKLADLVVTDPPYNVNYEGGTKERLKISNDNMSDGDFYRFLYDFYTALNSFTKKGGAWYVWHADSKGVHFRQAMTDAGILLKQCLIWVKNSLVLGRQDYQWRHEPCLEGINSENWEWVKVHEPCLYGWKEGDGHFWKGGRKQTTVLEFDKPAVNKEHPTMKPVALIGHLISNSSQKGDIVADGFGGSGTTMVASHQLERICYMAECDPKYCQVIIDRMLKLDKEIKIKKNGEKYEKTV